MNDWIFSLSSKTLVFILSLLFIVSVVALAQQENSLELTELEKTKLELIRVKQEKAILEANQIQAQMQSLQTRLKELGELYPKLQAEEKALIEEAAKAHGVDTKTHKLKDDLSGFEALSKPPERKK